MNTHYAIYVRCLVFAAMELKLQQVLYLIFLLVAKPFNVWMKHVRHDDYACPKQEYPVDGNRSK